jgi:hypothetical protein
MKVYWTTNLDLRGEQWPETDVLPPVGATIRSLTKHQLVTEGCDLSTRVLEVRVCAVTLIGHSAWEVELGLHSRWKSMAHFDCWYDYICGHGGDHETYCKRSAEALKASGWLKKRERNPKLTEQLVRAIYQLNSVRSKMIDMCGEDARYALTMMDRATSAYEREDHDFPARIEIDGRVVIVESFEGLPLGKAFKILELGVMPE